MLNQMVTELNATKAYAYDCLIQQKQWGENLQNAENRIVKLSQEVNRINKESQEHPVLIDVNKVGSEAEDDIQP